MQIYLIYIAVVIFNLLIFRNSNSNLRDRKIIILICSFGLLLIASLRSESVGKDVENYLKFFELLNYIDFNTLLKEIRYENGFIYLSKLISLITENAQIFIAILSIIILAGPINLIYKYSKNPSMSFIFYVTMTFFAFSLSGLRQALATSIVLFAYDYLVKRKLVKFVAIVLFASLFHSSIIIFLIAYPIAHRRITTGNMIFYSTIFIILFILKKVLLGLIINQFFEQYSYTLSSSNSITYMLTMILVLISGLFYYKRIMIINPNAITLYNMLIIAVFVQLFGMESSNIVRLSELFYIFVIIFIPEVIESFSDKAVKVISYILVLTFILIQFIYIFPGGGYGVYPYFFFWEHNL
jgi:hypothetical protein